MEMNLELRILAYAVVLIFAGLAVFLILTLKKLHELLEKTSDNIEDLSNSVSMSLERLTDDIDEIKLKLFASLDGVDKLTGTLTEATENMDKSLNRVFNVLEPLGKLIDTFVCNVYPSVSRMASMISASSKAVNAFLTVLGRKK